MPKIKIIKSIAKRDFQRRIDEGQEIINKLSDVGAIISHKDFLEAQEEQNRWSEGNVSLLKTFFDDDLLVMEYGNLSVGDVGEDNSLLENIRGLRETVEQRVAWLNNLVNQIDGFPQSEKTPMPIKPNR